MCCIFCCIGDDYVNHRQCVIHSIPSGLKVVKILFMKLHLTQPEDTNLITAYDDDFVEVNKERYSNHLIVMPNQIIEDWAIEGFAKLTVAHFTDMLELNPEVILLGTGKTHQFVHPKLTAALIEKGIAVECMTTHAACRTYNILMSEGRHVAAALLLAREQ
jgi:uncharacterized protein